MGRYRKIDTRIWNDAKFRGLSDRAKLAFFFLLTHPHMTSLGAMRATISGLASEIGWPEKSFRAAFVEISRLEMVNHEEESCFVCLPNFLKYNPPESPNVIKSWDSSMDLIPECESKVQLLQQVKAFAEGLGEAFRKALPKPLLDGSLTDSLPKGFPKTPNCQLRGASFNQEQEQEHEQEHNTPKPPKGDSLSIGFDFERFWREFPSGRKTGKDAALKAFTKALKKTDSQTIITAAREYAASPLGRSDYVKGPTPWLNQGCWNDDRSAWNRGEDSAPQSAYQEIERV